MKKINYENTNRNKVYNWFKTFSNTTYGCNVKINVTNLVNHSKKNNESFFIDMLYIVLKGLNSVEEMKIRLVNDQAILYDEIYPSYTVMNKKEFYDNVKQKNYDSFKEFYKATKQNIDNVKNETTIKKGSYNNNDSNYYYITCLPWVNITSITHPIPDDKSSQSVPRICWGKYEVENDKYYLTLNITVSHMFVDGYPLSKVFTKIEDLLTDIDNILK